PVAVRVEVLPRPERNPVERHGNVPLARVVLGAASGGATQGPDPDVGLRECRDVPDTTVDDHARPAVPDTEIREAVAEERAAPRTAPVHHQHPSLAGLLEGGAYEGVVLKSLDGGDRAGEPHPSAEIEKTGLADLHCLLVCVVQIRSGKGHGWRSVTG